MPGTSAGPAPTVFAIDAAPKVTLLVPMTLERRTRTCVPSMLGCTTLRIVCFCTVWAWNDDSEKGLASSWAMWGPTHETSHVLSASGLAAREMPAAGPARARHAAARAKSVERQILAPGLRPGPIRPNIRCILPFILLRPACGLRFRRGG